MIGYPMDPNAIYYTLSTIAQTLAGALAILVAFVLFNLHRVDSYLDESRGFGLQGRNALREALRAFRAGKELPTPVPQFVLERGYASSQVRPRLYTALGFSVADVTLCFIALPFTPQLACSRWAAFILGIIVALGITCLALYVRLIYAMVGPPE